MRLQEMRFMRLWRQCASCGCGGSALHAAAEEACFMRLLKKRASCGCGGGTSHAAAEEACFILRRRRRASLGVAEAHFMWLPRRLAS